LRAGGWVGGGRVVMVVGGGESKHQEFHPAKILC